MCIIRITKKGGGREYVGGKNMQHVFFCQNTFRLYQKSSLSFSKGAAIDFAFVKMCDVNKGVPRLVADSDDSVSPVPKYGSVCAVLHCSSNYRLFATFSPFIR